MEGSNIMKNNRIFAALAAMAGMTRAFNFPQKIRQGYSDTAFQRVGKSVRNPKDPAKKADIIRRRKAAKLSKLSKPKRRAVYQYNLRHPVTKMYA